MHHSSFSSFSVLFFSRRVAQPGDDKHPGAGSLNRTERTPLRMQTCRLMQRMARVGRRKYCLQGDVCQMDDRNNNENNKQTQKGGVNEANKVAYQGVQSEPSNNIGCWTERATQEGEHKE